jgi:proliferating cell nuclear antigen PCNA
MKETKESKKILNFKVNKITSLKTIIDTLSKIVSETVWTIHNPKEKNKFAGLEITTVDKSKTLFVKIQIPKSDFLEFDCKNEKHELGINLEKFSNIIKFVDKDDIINFNLTEKDLQYLMIDITRASTKGKKNLKFSLIEIEHNEKPIKKDEYEKIISLSPTIYKKIFKEYDAFDNVKIKCSDKNIIFVYKDDTGTEINDEYILNEDGINLENSSSDEIYIGVFPISNLILFTKCAGLCEDIEIYMKDKGALIIKLKTMTFGIIKLSLSPVKEDCIKNTDYDYSDDEDDIVIIDNKFNKLK